MNMDTHTTTSSRVYIHIRRMDHLGKGEKVIFCGGKRRLSKNMCIRSHFVVSPLGFGVLCRTHIHTYTRVPPRGVCVYVCVAPPSMFLSALQPTRLDELSK